MSSLGPRLLAIKRGGMTKEIKVSKGEFFQWGHFSNLWAYTNITPAGDTIRDALEALDAAVGNEEERPVCANFVNGNAGAITLGQAVYKNATADEVDLADKGTPAGNTDNPIGIVGEATIAAAASGLICSQGLVPGAITGLGFSPGDKIFLGNAGALQNTVPAQGSGDNVVFMGYAKNATDIYLRIEEVGRRRA